LDSSPFPACDRAKERAEPPRPGRDAAQAVTPAAPAARAGHQHSGCSKGLVYNWCHARRNGTALDELAAIAHPKDFVPTPTG
jgi:hypothetical protein